MEELKQVPNYNQNYDQDSLGTITAHAPATVPFPLPYGLQSFPPPFQQQYPGNPPKDKPMYKYEVISSAYEAIPVIVTADTVQVNGESLTFYVKFDLVAAFNGFVSFKRLES